MTQTSALTVMPNVLSSRRNCAAVARTEEDFRAARMSPWVFCSSTAIRHGAVSPAAPSMRWCRTQGVMRPPSASSWRCHRRSIPAISSPPPCREGPGTGLDASRQPHDTPPFPPPQGGGKRELTPLLRHAGATGSAPTAGCMVTASASWSRSGAPDPGRDRASARTPCGPWRRRCVARPASRRGIDRPSSIWRSATGSGSPRWMRVCLVLPLRPASTVDPSAVTAPCGHHAKAARDWFRSYRAAASAPCT